MKVVAGNLPEVLGASYTFDSSIVNYTPHIITKQEPGTFLLQIKQTELKDTAFYYCEEISELQKSLMNVTFLKVKGNWNHYYLTDAQLSDFKFLCRKKCRLHKLIQYIPLHSMQT